MSLSLPKTCWRIFNTIFYGTALLLLVRYAIIVPLGSCEWFIGDWLINYQGGFVRRGLIGEILFRISPLTGIDISALVVVLQLSLYLIFFMNAYVLSINSSFTPLNAMVICSPAFILFPIHDPIGGFRKEILLFALLSTLCNRLSDFSIKIPGGLPACIGLTCAVIVLSHEMLIVCLPYLICALIIRDKELSTEAKKTALFMMPSVAITIFLLFFGKGDKQVVVDICNSLRTSVRQDCICPGEGGAIAWLGKDIAFAHALVLAENPTPTLIVYAVSATLGFLPLVLKILSKQFSELLINEKLRFWLTICIGSALVATLPLLWVAADYGRLIYIHITCLSLLTLMATPERNSVDVDLNLRDIGYWLLCFLFISGWRLIHINVTPQKAFTFYTIMSRLFDR